MGQLQTTAIFQRLLLANGACTLGISPADIAATQSSEEEHSKCLTATGVR